MLDKIPPAPKVYVDPYREGLKDLVVYYAGIPGIREMLKTMPSVCSIISSFYFVLVGAKELVSINDLEKSEKQRLWDATDGEKPERIKQARALYVLEAILKDFGP